MINLYLQLAASLALAAVFLYALGAIDQMNKPPARIRHAWVGVAMSAVLLIMALIFWSGGVYLATALFTASVAWMLIVERRGLRSNPQNFHRHDKP